MVPLVHYSSVVFFSEVQFLCSSHCEDESLVKSSLNEWKADLGFNRIVFEVPSNPKSVPKARFSYTLLSSQRGL